MKTKLILTASLFLMNFSMLQARPKGPTQQAATTQTAQQPVAVQPSAQPQSANDQRSGYVTNNSQHDLYIEFNNDKNLNFVAKRNSLAMPNATTVFTVYIKTDTNPVDTFIPVIAKNTQTTTSITSQTVPASYIVTEIDGMWYVMQDQDAVMHKVTLLH